jgi:hypothetical protein
MNETAQLIHDAAHRLFAQHVTPELLLKAEKGEWSDALWGAVDEAGFLDTLADTDTPLEERTANTFALLRAAARHLVPIPLGETIIVRALLAARKVRAPDGPLSFGVLDGHTHQHGDHAHLKGKALRIAYARNTTGLLLGGPDATECVLVATRRGRLSESTNIAGEPRDSLTFADTAGTTVSGINGRDLEFAGATLRSISMAGALERILMQTVDYARTRVQFGKPIGSFQLMQGKLADMYVALSTAQAYTYAVAQACDRGETTRKDSAGCILYSAEKATWMALEAIQCLGGNGYINEYPTGRLLRDAKLYEIGAGTSEIRRYLIGRELFEETK